MSNISQPPVDGLWTEPESAATVENPPQYPYNSIQQTESGHSFEMDDTPSRERVRLQHRSGTFLEMHPNGDEVHKVYGTGYEIHLKGKNVLIKGVCNITIEGDANMEVKGDHNLKVSGDYNILVGGKMNTRVVGDISLSGDDDISIAANENFGGSIRMAASDHVFVDSDLVVAGSVAADMVTAESRINAGTGVYAGPLGVFSLGTVIAPIAKFGIMDAVLMSDIINSNIYNYHEHLYVDTNDAGAFIWTTSTPLIPFIGV
jgi:hypothetical protein